MSAAQRLVVAIFLLGGALQALGSQDTAGATIDQAAIAAAQTAQIEINRKALVEDKDEKTRLDAAMVLLISDNPNARKALLQTLRDPNCELAHAAICQTLIAARENKTTIANRSCRS